MGTTAGAGEKYHHIVILFIYSEARVMGYGPAVMSLLSSSTSLSSSSPCWGRRRRQRRGEGGEPAHERSSPIYVCIYVCTCLWAGERESNCQNKYFQIIIEIYRILLKLLITERIKLSLRNVKQLRFI